MTPDLLLDAEVHATGDPHAVWAWLRAHDPVHWHEAGDLPGFWSVTRYDDVRAVYRDPATFSSAHGVLLRPTRFGPDPGGGQTLALTDPPRHKHLRALMGDWFSERAAREMEAAVTAAAREVVDRAIATGVCDFAHDVAARLTLEVVCRVMGFPAEDHEDVFRWTTEAFASGRALATHRDVMAYFVAMTERRAAEPDDDLVSALVHGEVDGDLLSETEILLNFENLVGASENAGLSMAAGLLAFLDHPDQWERLRADRALLPLAVEEVLRWTTSATHSMRTATAPALLGGRRINPGDRVVVWLPSANRDEEVFDEPFRFDVGRKPNRHLALGIGEHVCIGSTVARTQMRALFSVLLDAAERVELAGPVVPLRSLAVNGPEHLPVRIVPRIVPA